MTDVTLKEIYKGMSKLLAIFITKNVVFMHIDVEIIFPHEAYYVNNKNIIAKFRLRLTF